MSRKTTSYTLPILLKNEAKYEDCIQIMDSYEHQIEKWYRECGRIDDFKNCKIPIGGDQLTRVRLDGAKNLRIGAHTPEERFDNLYPVIVEMFHTQMDFLEKTIKKFFKRSSGRDMGTLFHLKTVLQRTSVNGNVKSRFKLLSRLNRLHITTSAESKSNIIGECCENREKHLKKSVADGQNGKLNGDNVDIFVTTNDIRMSNKSKDYHFFATDYTPFRVTDEDF